MPPGTQAALGGVGNGLEIFKRACTRAGLLGFLLAFILGFLAYAVALTAATVLLKWILVWRMPAGVHKCAPPPSLSSGPTCLRSAPVSWRQDCHFAEEPGLSPVVLQATEHACTLSRCLLGGKRALTAV